MTVNASEGNPQTPLSQEKIENAEPAQKVETAVSQPVEKANEEVKEDPNWRAFREARKKDRAEREAAERRAAEKEAEAAALKAAMEAAFARENARIVPQATGYYQEHEETEDERIEKKVQAAIAARETAAEKARLEREMQEYPNRLTQAYPDFNALVTAENLDYLEYHFPEVSRPLKRQTDGFEKWSDIYHAVKKFVPNALTAKKEAAKADANFAKPKSLSSTGLTQSTEAGAARLTEERKAANWERMQRALKGVG